MHKPMISDEEHHVYLAMFYNAEGVNWREEGFHNAAKREAYYSITSFMRGRQWWLHKSPLVCRIDLFTGEFHKFIGVPTGEDKDDLRDESLWEESTLEFEMDMIKEKNANKITQ